MCAHRRRLRLTKGQNDDKHLLRALLNSFLGWTSQPEIANRSSFMDLKAWSSHASRDRFPTFQTVDPETLIIGGCAWGLFSHPSSSAQKAYSASERPPVKLGFLAGTYVCWLEEELLASSAAAWPGDQRLSRSGYWPVSFVPPVRLRSLFHRPAGVNYFQRS
jgi:hypothetical protein